MKNASFIVHNPMVIKRVVRNYFLKICMLKNPLRTVDISLDYICNFNCKHCYATDFVDINRRAMDMTDIITSVDACLRHGAIHFNIIGGEPTMDSRLFDIMDYIHSKGALISLATNGSLLTVDFVKKLKKHSLDLALVSMDYFDPVKQDDFRGKGYFDKAISAVENCLKIGVRVYISAVITKDEIEGRGFKGLITFCEQRKILLHVNLPAFFGRWKGREDLFLSEKDKKKVRDLYKNKYIRACEMSSYFACACKAGFEKMHITAYGDVIPCALIPISFGNILQDSLPVIRERMFHCHFFSGHNEMCIPSTNREYLNFYQKKISPKKILPVRFDEL